MPGTGLLIEASALAAAVVAIVLVLRVFASDTAGGADSYGYVSEAIRLSNGHFYEAERVFAPFGLAENSQMTFTLGYTPYGPNGTVPTYPFGYPLIMAAMIRLLGFGAAFWVSAALAAGAAAATYVTGRIQIGRAGGVLAAGLVLLLPTFLWDTFLPMSDVPATFFAAVALALLLLPRPRAWLDVLLGAVVGYGIWVRPNLLLLVVPTFVWLAWRREWWRLIRAGVSGLPFLGVEVLVNQRLFGSPFVTGYGSILLTPSLTDAAERGIRHLQRLNDQQAGLGLALVVAGLIFGRLPLERRVLLLGFGAVFLVFFAFYPIDDAWWYGRFLLPGLPAIAILEASAVARLWERGPVPLLRGALLVGGLVWFGRTSIAYGRDRGVFNVSQGEIRYQTAARLAREQIQQPAFVLAMQHSGTLRLYGGLPTARYDLGSVSDQVSAIQQVSQRGGSVYLVGDGAELENIRRSDRSVLLVGAERLGGVDPLETTVLRLHVPVVPLDFPMQHPLRATFGGQIELLGYDLSPNALRSGPDLSVALYWHPVRLPDHDYTVFIHVVDDAGHIVAQSDSYPVEGHFPTSAWSDDYVVKDTHHLKLPPAGSKQSFQIDVGLYRLETMQRLPPIAASGTLATDYVQLASPGIP